MAFGDFLFWALAVTAVSAAAMLLFSRSIVHMAFWLLAALAAFAGLYLRLGADFLGFTQVVVYIGGVLILFLFGVMLTHRADIALRRVVSHRFLVPGALAGGLLSGFLVWLVSVAPWATEAARAPVATSEEIGVRLLSTYVLPFEAVSILLLVSMIGATYLARGHDPDEGTNE